MKSEETLLLLEDGTAFAGLPFGEVGEAIGEAVFYTGVVGYQEVITHPSYHGTLLTMTYPIIGSYGVNDEDNESSCVQVRGIVVQEYSRCVSNFRATGALEDFLKENHVVGIQGVDTRAVVVHLRDHGEMRAMIAPADARREDLLNRLKATPSPFEADLVGDQPGGETLPAAGEQRHRIAALDLGLTRSLTAQLAQLGCAVDVLPSRASAADVLAREPEGLVVAGGPGDPRLLESAIETVRALAGKLPILGIGLGHQVAALALGCGVRRLKTGHHGVNYPVRHLADRHCDITVQHHSFVVDESAVPASVEATYLNINDGTVEGIASKEARVAGVQFHPAPDEMGRPSGILGAFVEGKR